MNIGTVRSLGRTRNTRLGTGFARHAQRASKTFLQFGRQFWEVSASRTTRHVCAYVYTRTVIVKLRENTSGDRVATFSKSRPSQSKPSESISCALISG